MSRLKLTLATADYDHVADLAQGRVQPEGIELTALTEQIEDIFFRMLNFGEFDVSEMSTGKFSALTSQDDRRFIGIPVFPSRIHRHSSIYIRTDGKVRTPADLVGKRVGVPEWAQTAAIYSRGALQHQYGLDLRAIRWVQSGVNQPGRAEKVSLNLPAGIEIERVTDRSLNQMLLDGYLDAVLSAHPPESIEHGDKRVCRMFENYIEVESQYYRDTGIFPIMHVIVIKREIAEANPWAPLNLFRAFEEAKRRSVARMLDMTAPRVPIPWCYERAAEAQRLFGEDHWPYGIEKNRRTLEAFLGFAYEQGVCKRPLRPEDLFPPQFQKSVKV